MICHGCEWTICEVGDHMRGLYVRKSKYSMAYRMVLLLFFLYFFHRYAVELGASSLTRYVLDFVNIAIYIYSLQKKYSLEKIDKALMACYGGILIIGTVSAILNIWTWKSGIVYYLFDCRNLIRFLIFFQSCKVLVKPEEVDNILNWFLCFHILNCILVVYQYFTLEVPIFWMRGDNLNGFFGTATGGNIYINVLLISTAMIALYRWSNRRGSMGTMLFIQLLNLVIATLIEIKMYYVEMVLICVFFAIPYMRRPSRKRFAWGMFIIFGGVVSFVVLIPILYKIYPWMEGTMSLSYMVNAFSTERGEGISRLSAVPDVIEKIFENDLYDSLFGIGLGTANINGMRTEFAQKFYWTNYSWYSTAYMLIETGVVGLIIYIISFLMLFFNIKRDALYASISKCMCLIAIILMIYNESLKTEAGYMIFFLIAIGFSGKREQEGEHGRR